MTGARPGTVEAVGWCGRSGRIGMIYTFDSYELDLDQFELRRDGERVAVEPQVFDVLAHLVEQRTRVVSKVELLESVWKTTFVTESALTSRVKAARQAVGDDGRSQRMIRTLH
jgi:DNA-binding winged helix-turn-helix (wHTH) protein